MSENGNLSKEAIELLYPQGQEASMIELTEKYVREPTLRDLLNHDMVLNVIIIMKGIKPPANKTFPSVLEEYVETVEDPDNEVLTEHLTTIKEIEEAPEMNNWGNRRYWGSRGHHERRGEYRRHHGGWSPRSPNYNNWSHKWSQKQRDHGNGHHERTASPRHRYTGTTSPRINNWNSDGWTCKKWSPRNDYGERIDSQHMMSQENNWGTGWGSRCRGSCSPRMNCNTCSPRRHRSPCSPRRHHSPCSPRRHHSPCSPRRQNRCDNWTTNTWSPERKTTWSKEHTMRRDVKYHM